MRKSYFYIIIFIFSFYWVCTLIAVSPKNFIKINLYEQEQVFNALFYQKWGFFAPPPNYNDRLYFQFESKKDTTKLFLFEVMEDLQKRKSKKAPFNSSEDILDYILSSSLNNVTNGLITINNSIDYEKEISDTILSDIYVNEKMMIEGKKYVQALPSFKTLKNYALFIAKKNNIDNINDYYLTVQIIQLEMPKFADRLEIQNFEKYESKLVFKSDKIEL
jgi:hypothetical protein